MTENEIVQYLKENKNKGVMFTFMPKEVREWCFHKKEYHSDFLVYKLNRGWVEVSDDFLLNAGYVIALPEDFKLREKPESGWVEFEINQTSKDFLVEVEKENCNDCNEYYCWFEVERFLRDSVDNDRGYTAFGGWQYPNSSYWSTYPQVKTGRGDNYSSYYCEREQGEDYEINPAIPVKIRFWREKK